MAEQAERPLRSFGQSEWAERLQTESGNLAAAVRWYLAHDPAPLPHLFGVLSPFRVLWVFWGLRYEIMSEARSWVVASLSMVMNRCSSAVLSCQVRALTRLPSVTQG